MLNSAMSVVILAAGKGTRMYSDLPKVLHTLAGKPMVQHVIDAANELGASQVHLVYGHGGDLLKKRCVTTISTGCYRQNSWVRVMQCSRLHPSSLMMKTS